jgi:WD40 repeat protein
VEIDTRSGETRDLPSHSASISFLACSADAQLVAAGDATGRMLLLRRDTGEAVMDWRAHQLRVVYASFSPDGARLVTSGREGTVATWPTDPEAAVATLRRTAPRRVDASTR